MDKSGVSRRSVNRSVRIIHIDFEPAEIDSHYDVALDIQADIADALWQINEMLHLRFHREGQLPLFDIGERGAPRIQSRSCPSDRRLA